MAVIIGHSQVKYLCENIFDDIIFSLCFPGYKVLDFLREDVFEVVREANVVCVMAGANDIPSSDADTVLEHLQQLCEKIHDSNPSAIVVVSGILPRAENRFRKDRDVTFLENFNRIAAEVNMNLRVVPEHVPWVHYAEHSEFFRDGLICRDMLSRDGLHLSPRGAACVARDLERRIADVLSARPTVEIVDKSRPEEAGPLTYSEVVKSCNVVTRATEKFNVQRIGDIIISVQPPKPTQPDRSVRDVKVNSGRRHANRQPRRIGLK